MPDQRPRRSRRWSALLLLGAVPIATAGCGGASGDDASAAPAEPPAVEVAEARREPVSVRAASVGTLEAEQTVVLRAEAEGVVSAIPVAEGETVRRGQVLVRLDDRELAAQVEAAEATLERARTEAENLAARLERNRGLLEAGAISPQTLDDLESAHEAARARTEEAEANLRLARRRLEKTVIRAPFAGRLGERSFYAGDFLREGDPLMELVDDRPLRVEFDLPEAYLGRVEVGSPVRVEARSDPGRVVDGAVVFLSPRVDSETRTVRIEAEVPNPDGRLSPGQFVEVEIELERRADAVVIPEEAVVPRGGENFVFAVVDDTAKLRSVTLGERAPGRVEVLSGVEAGEQVVVAGQQRIQDGAAVRTTERLDEPEED
ncbi:MAG: efflux RND transporter periplasmic adaptor subunit [Thermoanaerobaculia bacterium]